MIQIIRSKKENCNTCTYQDNNGMDEPCVSCMMDKLDKDVNYYTRYNRDYDKWPESDKQVIVVMPPMIEEDDDDG